MRDDTHRSLPAEAVARLFHTVNPLPNFPPTWNMAPTQDAMVVRHHPDTGERHLDLLKWGLLPYFTKDPVHAKRPINARAETVATSGMFRSAFAKRRCLVPADAFYEWKMVEGGKQPYAIARQDGQPMAFAGLWEGFKWPDGTVLRTFTIITTNANETVGELHDRMPVILEPAGLADVAGRSGRRSCHAVQAGWRGCAEGLASQQAGEQSPRNNGAELLEAIGQARD